jgi:hypothetical protein
MDQRVTESTRGDMRRALIKSYEFLETSEISEGAVQRRTPSGSWLRQIRRTKSGSCSARSVNVSGSIASPPGRVMPAYQHLVTRWSQDHMHLLEFFPEPGLAHLPTQFAALFSQCGPSVTASACELKSTPMPMSAIAKKKCRAMFKPPEKDE